jgi:hypothetical protein
VEHAPSLTGGGITVALSDVVPLVPMIAAEPECSHGRSPPVALGAQANHSNN